MGIDLILTSNVDNVKLRHVSVNHSWQHHGCARRMPLVHHVLDQLH